MAIYYVALAGNNTDGLSEVNAWNSLSSLESNLGIINAGDTIQFKGGDEFYGNLSITSKIATLGNEILFTSYGTGKAVINGSKDLTSWVDQGGNVWRASTGADTAYQVFKNNEAVTICRTPNIGISTEPKSSYETSTSAGTKTSITTSTLTGGGSLVGGIINVSSESWVLETRTILTHNTGTGAITWGGNLQYDIKNGSRFFISNHSSLLTSQDYWRYNSGNVDMYSVGIPTGITMTTLSGNLINITTSSYLKFENLIIRDSYNNGFEVNGSNNISCSGIELKYAYYIGINLINSDNFSFTGGAIQGSNREVVAIDLNSSNTNISIGNEIFDIGISKNLLPKQITAPKVTEIYGANATFEGNNIHDIGYIGVILRGQNAIITKNIIQDFSLIMDDGSAIYSHNGNWSDSGASGSVISYNIVIGHSFTGTWFANGLYTDDRSHNTTWEYNTVIGTYYGIYMHNNADVTFRYNNIYGTTAIGIYMQDDSIDDPNAGLMINNTVTYNEVFMTTIEINQIMALKIRTQWEDYAFGTIDFNKYWTPYYSNEIAFGTATIHGAGGTWDMLLYDLAVWNSSGGYGFANGFDANSDADNLNWTYPDANTLSQIIYNSTNTPINQSLDGIWENLSGTQFDSSINLQPFNSVILIYVGPSSGAGSVTITWTNSDTVGVTETVVYRDDVEVARILVANPSEYIDTTIVSGNTYKYEVQAVDPNGESVQEVDGINVTSILIP